MVKPLKKAGAKKSKAEEVISPSDSVLPIEEPESVIGTNDDPESDEMEKENEVHAKKKTPKLKSAKKEDVEASAHEDEADENKQNGEGESRVKQKKTPKKIEKEPARKSARTPKPVTIEGTENPTEKKGKVAKKRRSSKSPTKPAKKAKKVEKDYEVQEIVGVRIKKGKKEFKIRWKGYKPSDDTWEPENHLSCEDLINKYEKEHEESTKDEEPTPASKASAKGTKSRAKKAK